MYYHIKGYILIYGFFFREERHIHSVCSTCPRSTIHTEVNVRKYPRIGLCTTWMEILVVQQSCGVILSVSGLCILKEIFYLTPFQRTTETS